MEEESTDDDESSWTMITVAIVLAVLLVFLLFFFKLGDKYKQKAYDDVCNDYIKMNMMGNKAFLDVNSKNFPCKAEDVTLKSKQKYDLMKEVSDREVRCYNSYGNGDGKLFEGEESELIRFCAACYKISFSNPGITISKQEMLNFQGLNSNKKQTYLDILSPNAKGMKLDEISDPDTKELVRKALQTVEIDTTKQYMVIFTYDRKDEPTMIHKILKGAEIGGIITVTALIVVGTIMVTGGAALPLVVAQVASVTATAGGITAGGTIGYMNYKSSEKSSSVSSIALVPLDEESIANLKCDRIMGIQEPGITSSGIN